MSKNLLGESIEEAEDKGYTFDTDGTDLVITSPEGKTKVLKDFTYFDEDYINYCNYLLRKKGMEKA